LEELGDLAELLAGDPAEEELQKFLAHHSGFITGLFGYADSSTLAFFAKPRIGAKFVADFAVMVADQGASGISLVEIEPSTERLFTKDLRPARRYQIAIGQITEWREWIEPNQRTFCSDMVARAQSLPEWPSRAENRSFRTMPADRLADSWRTFGGDDFPVISYTIVCGRWANLSAEERKRLMLLNAKGSPFQTLTHDQVARTAFQRPFTDW
jgi:hypothetical protein